MIITFPKTVDLFPHKSVTRRCWSDRQHNIAVKAWREGRRRHKAYTKSQRCGGKQFAWIDFTQEPYRERLGDMPREHLLLEGGKFQAVDEFVEHYFAGDHDVIVSVISFDPVRLSPAYDLPKLPMRQPSYWVADRLGVTPIDPEMAWEFYAIQRESPELFHSWSSWRDPIGVEWGLAGTGVDRHGSTVSWFASVEGDRASSQEVPCDVQ